MYSEEMFDEDIKEAKKLVSKIYNLIDENTTSFSVVFATTALLAVLIEENGIDKNFLDNCVQLHLLELKKSNKNDEQQSE